MTNLLKKLSRLKENDIVLLNCEFEKRLHEESKEGYNFEWDIVGYVYENKVHENELTFRAGYLHGSKRDSIFQFPAFSQKFSINYSDIKDMEILKEF